MQRFRRIPWKWDTPTAASSRSAPACHFHLPAANSQLTANHTPNQVRRIKSTLFLTICCFFALKLNRDVRKGLCVLTLILNVDVDGTDWCDADVRVTESTAETQLARLVSSPLTLRIKLRHPKPLLIIMGVRQHQKRMLLLWFTAMWRIAETI